MTGVEVGDELGDEALRDTLRQVRAGMAEAADGIRSPGLLTRVHAQARRRRRLTVTAAVSGAAVAATVLGIAALSTPWQDGAPRVVTSAAPGTAVTQERTAAGTATSTSSALVPPASVTSPVRATAASPGRSPSPTGGRPGSRSPNNPSPSNPSPSNPPATAGAGAWRTDFDAAPAIGGRWIPYTDGGTNAWTAFSPDGVTTSGGMLRLTARHDATGTALVGGTRAVSGTAATGRWEARWRMSTGNDLVGVLVFGDAADRYPFTAVLDPSAGTLTVTDERAGKSRTVTTATSAFHRLALTVTTTGSSWQLDGTTIAAWTGHGPGSPMWPAFQVDSLHDCRSTPADGRCTDPTEPPALQVDWLAYSPG